MRSTSQSHGSPQQSARKITRLTNKKKQFQAKQRSLHRAHFKWEREKNENKTPTNIQLNISNCVHFNRIMVWLLFTTIAQYCLTTFWLYILINAIAVTIAFLAPANLFLLFFFFASHTPHTKTSGRFFVLLYCVWCLCVCVFFFFFLPATLPAGHHNRAKHAYHSNLISIYITSHCINPCHIHLVPFEFATSTIVFS